MGMYILLGNLLGSFSDTLWITKSIFQAFHQELSLLVEQNSLQFSLFLENVFAVSRTNDMGRCGKILITGHA